MGERAMAIPYHCGMGRLFWVVMLVVVGCGGGQRRAAQPESEQPFEGPPQDQPPVVEPPPEPEPYTTMADPVSGPRPHFDNADVAWKTGNQHFNLGQYEQAIAAFASAFELSPKSAFLYNIAQAFRQLDNLPRAVFFYKAFLRLEPKHPRRAELEGRIVELEAAIERARAAWRDRRAMKRQMVGPPPG